MTERQEFLLKALRALHKAVEWIAAGYTPDQAWASLTPEERRVIEIAAYGASATKGNPG